MPPTATRRGRHAAAGNHQRRTRDDRADDTAWELEYHGTDGTCMHTPPCPTGRRAKEQP